MSGDDTIPAPPEVHAGNAQQTMLAALANLTAAVIALERVAMAVARALDETASRGPEQR
jgi:hypothetical protein